MQGCIPFFWLSWNDYLSNDWLYPNIPHITPMWHVRWVLWWPKLFKWSVLLFLWVIEHAPLFNIQTPLSNVTNKLFEMFRSLWNILNFESEPGICICPCLLILSVMEFEFFQNMGTTFLPLWFKLGVEWWEWWDWRRRRKGSGGAWECGRESRGEGSPQGPLREKRD